jgi:hypothetical protein
VKTSRCAAPLTAEICEQKGANGLGKSCPGCPLRTPTHNPAGTGTAQRVELRAACVVPGSALTYLKPKAKAGSGQIWDTGYVVQRLVAEAATPPPMPAVALMPL